MLSLSSDGSVLDARLLRQTGEILSSCRAFLKEPLESQRAVGFSSTVSRMCAAIYCPSKPAVSSKPESLESTTLQSCKSASFL